MPDLMNKAARSRCMASIRSVNTRPELLVRKTVFSLGYRYCLHGRSLPGRPDLVFPRLRAVIFVNGCFWHQHRCADGHLPVSRKDYWTPKLKGNRKRDFKRRRQLRLMGWQVLTIWECQTADHEKLQAILKKFFSTISQVRARP